MLNPKYIPYMSQNINCSHWITIFHQDSLFSFYFFYLTGILLFAGFCLSDALFSSQSTVVGDGGGARAAPPHISGKKIFRQMPWKIPAFSDKYYVNFSHFWANITHNSGILLIFHTHLQVKMSPPKLTELLWAKQVRLGPQKRTLQDGFCWSINSIEALHT